MRHLAVAILFIFAVSGWAQGADSLRVYRSTEVDSKPNLKNGMYTLTKFVSDHFAYPENIRNKQVKIFTSFIVEPNGSMTDVKSFYISVKDLVPLEMVSIMTEEQKAAEQSRFLQMQGEAARVLKLFKETWIPAQIGGKPVRCLYNYPISFNLE